MSAELVTLYAPTSYVLKLVGETSLVLATADFPTLTVASDVLPAYVTAELTARLRTIIGRLPVAEDGEDALAGILRGLIGVRQLEAPAMTVTVDYAAPTASFTLSDLADPAHIALSIPHAMSPPIIGA